MGLIHWLFGGGMRTVGDTAEQVGGIFRENAERGAQRAHDIDAAVLAQYAAEFHQRSRRTLFDSLVDSLNRLPRPMIAMLVIALLALPYFEPEEANILFTSWALLPNGYWGLLLTVIGFYFGGRMQSKRHEFQNDIAASVARASAVIETMNNLRDHLTPGEASDDDPQTSIDLANTEIAIDQNPAVDDWKSATAV